jgi:hypothetical protein
MVAVTSCDKDNDPINEDPTPIITYDQLQGSWDMVSVNIEGTVYLADDDFPDKNKVISEVTFYKESGMDMFYYHNFGDGGTGGYYLINPVNNTIEGSDPMGLGKIYFYMLSINSNKTQIVLRSGFSFMGATYRPIVGDYTFQKRQ